jgi:amino acid adenylation domain-containing protein
MSEALDSVSPALTAYWQVVCDRAADRGEKRAFTFLASGEAEAEVLSYGELDLRARAVAVGLRKLAEPGDRVLLLPPPGLGFVAALLGCLYAGVVAVPAYPPRPGRGEGRIRALLADARPRVAVATEATMGRLARTLEEPSAGRGAPAAPALRWLAVDRVPDSAARRWRPPAADPDAVAFLQYTSGSTATPRGVQVTHRSLLANERAIERAFDQSEDSVVVGWLPVYHDMGLIGNVLQPLWSGGSCVLMSPAAFLQRPRRWLEAIHRYRATTSGGPDSAYGLTLRKVPAEDRAGLDLSTWRVAFDGSEPVRAETLERFAEAFRPQGFRREAFLPCYGLAEATLFVSGAGAGEGARVRRLGAADLERGRGVLAPPDFGPGAARRLVGCGGPGLGVEVAVVDPERRVRRRAGEVGEVWVAGEGVAAGYFRRPEETAATFGARLADGSGGGPFLRTGDLGFLSEEGELFVTGRSKDLIIVRGRNLYPQDVERTAEAAHPAVSPAGAAAFPVEEDGEERLAVVFELERRREGEAGAAVPAVRRAVAAEHEAAVAAALAIAAGELPRTSSGKVRRGECRRRFLAGAFRSLAASPEERLAGDRPAVSAGDLLGAVGPGPEAAAAYLGGLAAALGAPVVPDEHDAPLVLDSLQALELRNRVAADLGVELPFERLLEGASPAVLGRVVAGVLGAAPRSARPVSPGPQLASGAETGGDGHPVTPGQRALCLLERLGASGGGAGDAYTIAFAARLERPAGEPPSPEALRSALEALAGRHPALRTVFPAAGGGPGTTRVLPAAPSALDFAVLPAPSPVGDDAALRRRLSDEARRPFDLERGPVTRARVVPGPAGPVLLLAVHHAALDLWSLELLLEDLAALLAGRVLPPAVPFAAFARWQARYLAGPAGAVLRAFWREELTGAPAVLDLPSDRPRPPVAGPAGERLPFRLPPAAAEGARALAERGGASLFAVLLAAFAALLARLSGRDDFLVGSPAAGRSRAGLEGVVGYLANLLPVRVELGDDPSFGELLARTRERVARLLEHQDLPFPLVVEEAAPPRDRSRHPLVQAAVVLERPHRLRQPGAAAFVLGREGARVEVEGLALEAVALDSRSVQLDLMLVAATAGEALEAAFDYSTDLFDRTTVRRWARSLGELLGAGAADPGRRVGELPVLAAAERAQLLVEWNDTAKGEPRAATVHGLVAARAAELPEAVAVEGVTDGGRPVVLSYGELVRRARERAPDLRAAGAGPERGVAVLLDGAGDRSAELVVTLLAVLEAGSYYVPVDRRLPPARREAMLEAVRPAVVVDGRGVRPGRGPSGRLPSARPSPALPAEALAYVLFTSGSTGAPKGIEVPHRALVRLVDRPGYARLGPDETVLQLAPLAFDASTFEIWGPLAAGGRLVVPAPGPMVPATVERDLARHRVTCLWLTAGLFHLVAEERPGAFHPLRELLAGGDVLAPAAVRRALAAMAGGGRVIDGYGPTEGTTFTATLALADPASVPAPVPIGRPIGGTRVLLADRRLRPAPAGTPGEVLIGGPGLARGYAGRPALTAERFVPDPSAGTAGEPGGRLYRSGDLARWGADGLLRFLGRLDAQVKVRGFRVEPEEVEGALRRCPGVREAAVVRRGETLAAYFLPAGEGEAAPDAAELRARLAEELPSYMVPASFTAVGAMPLGATGKIDRQALERTAPAGAGAPARARRPRSELERTLTALWAEVLDVPPERVDPEASFFDLGGHSLQLARLHGRLGDVLGREIPVAELFDHPSVASLAAHVADRRGPAREDPGEPADGAARQRADLRRAAMARRRRVRAGDRETR